MDLRNSADTISQHKVVVTAQEQIYANLADDEVVILNLESGVYFGLNAVGARVWQLIQEPTSVRDVCDALLEEYDVDPDRCKCELLALLRDLASKGLIEVKDAADT